MNDKELNKCCCGDNENSCDCGHEHEHHHEHEHNHEHCDCGHDHDEESFLVELEDENGEIISCEVVDVFDYNNEEYVLVQNPNDGSVYLFRSVGEDGELVVPEDAEFDEVTAYYENELNNEEE